MTDPTPQPCSGNEATAFVIVPFPDVQAAQGYVDEIAEGFPSHVGVLITEGEEVIQMDPASGDVTYQITLKGGWRAQYAAEGTITMLYYDGVGSR